MVSSLAAAEGWNTIIWNGKLRTDGLRSMGKERCLQGPVDARQAMPKRKASIHYLGVSLTEDFSVNKDLMTGCYLE